MMWDPLLSDAEYSGELRVVASGEGRVNNHQFYLSRRDYASRNSDIMQRLLAELTQTGQFIDQHRQEAVGLLSAELGLNAASLARALARRSHRPRPMDLNVIRAQQSIADRFTRWALSTNRYRCARRSGTARPLIAIPAR